MESPKTPSKRSMKRAEEVMEERARMQKDTVTIIALAFDRLREETIEECAKVAQSHWVTGHNAVEENAGNAIAAAIRLKLKGGEDEVS